MPKAAFATIQLARFDTVRTVATVQASDHPGTLFCNVAADTRAAATEQGSQQAYKFVILGLHENEAAAHRLLDDSLRIAPWLAEAKEVWSAVLQPFRHKGQANYLDPIAPGSLFETMAPAPGPDTPFVAMTSAGWNLKDLDRNRVAAFSAGTSGIRTSMTAVDGLHSQQSFSFVGAVEADPNAATSWHHLVWDPMTVTFWRDNAAAVAFSYGAGVHRDQMTRYREENLADRTSFTRYIVLRCEGSWHGSAPQSW
jgi:hypothetical protein